MSGNDNTEAPMTTLERLQKIAERITTELGLLPGGFRCEAAYLLPRAEFFAALANPQYITCTD